MYTVSCLRVVILVACLWMVTLERAGARLAGDEGSAESRIVSAEHQAVAEHKVVLVIFGASWCGPCHLLQSYFADPRVEPILRKYVVIVNLDAGELQDDLRHADTPGAAELKRKLGGEVAGYPFYAFVLPDGNLISNSIQKRKDSVARTNLGFPSGPGEKSLFLGMVRSSIASISDSEISVLGATLERYSH